MRKKRNIILLALGLVMLLSAGGLAAWNSWEERLVSVETQGVKEIMEEIPPTYDLAAITEQLEEDIEPIPDYILDPNMEMPTVEVEGNYYVGTIKIPDLNVDLPVLSSWSYDLLKKSPCLYMGSIYAHNAIIMGHNYKIHFRAFWDAKPGMAVQFIDADGNVFNYTISWIEDLVTDDGAGLVNEDPDWDLTLFTCSYSGRSRTTLRCTLVDE